MASPLAPSSTIHIYPASILMSAPLPATMPHTTAPATLNPPNQATSSPATPIPLQSADPPSHLSTPQILPAPQTLIPPSAFTAKALSTKTIGAASKPVIKQKGPVEVEPLPSAQNRQDKNGEDGGGVKSKSTSMTTGEEGKMRNGYLAPGTSFEGKGEGKGKGKEREKKGTKNVEGDDDDDDDDGKEEKWIRYEVVESSITTTIEALQGGGKRTVWVRTDRAVTVLIEPAIQPTIQENKKEKTEKEKKTEKKAQTDKQEKAEKKKAEKKKKTEKKAQTDKKAKTEKEKTEKKKKKKEEKEEEEAEAAIVEEEEEEEKEEG